MGGHDDDDVRPIEFPVELGRGERELRQLGNMRVVIGDLGAQVAQAPDDLHSRRLAEVTDAGLVGDAEHEDP